MIDASMVDRYLARLHLEREPPSVDALFRLHRAQVGHIPYETTWIHLGEQWTVDPAESTRRVVELRRGGYCFHLNGAFSEVLSSLGYRVSRHVGGVHGPDGPDEANMDNHLVLTVSELPSEDNHGGVWYVDAGLGDALYEPLPLREIATEQGPFRLALAPAAHGAAGDWELTHDVRGSFTGMAFRARAADMHEFAERNVTLSTSPDSGFVKTMTVQRRDANGVDIIRGLVERRIDVDPARSWERTIASATELFELLADVFDLPLTDVDAARRAQLWHRLRATHDTWLRSLEHSAAASGPVREPEPAPDVG